jgi:hypothetical protein
VRDTGEMFKLIENLNFFEKVNLYISIYSNVDAGIGDIKFSEKYKISAERVGREIITDIKNSVRPYSFSKRRKLIRS